MKVDEKWQTRMLKSIDHLLHRRDAHDRSVIHYITLHVESDNVVYGTQTWNHFFALTHFVKGGYI